LKQLVSIRSFQNRLKTDGKRLFLSYLARNSDVAANLG
jgi:hypothetical protein